MGGLAASTGKGKTMIRLNNRNVVEIIDVLFVEGLKTTLLSTRRLFETDNLTTVLGAKGLIYKDKRLVATASKQNNGHYKLNGQLVLNNKVISYYGAKDNQNSLTIWHKSFGHLNSNILKHLINSGKLIGFNIKTVMKKFSIILAVRLVFMIKVRDFLFLMKEQIILLIHFIESILTF